MYVLILITVSLFCVSATYHDLSAISDELDKIVERKLAEKERVFVEREKKIAKTLQDLNERERRFAEREQSFIDREHEFDKRIKALEATCINGIDIGNESNNYTRRAVPTLPPSTPVAFSACVNPHDLTGLGKAQTIIFDHVETNLGGGYHSNLGVFFAPLKGVYVFHVSAMATDGHYIGLSLVKDGSVIHSMLTDSNSITDYTTSTGTWVLALDQQSEVYIRTYEAGGEIHGDCFTTFSGFLLQGL